MTMTTTMVRATAVAGLTRREAGSMGGGHGGGDDDDGIKGMTTMMMV